MDVWYVGIVNPRLAMYLTCFGVLLDVGVGLIEGLFLYTVTASSLTLVYS